VYTLGNKIPNTEFYASFETLTDEQSKQALLDAWATPTQQLYNLMHKTCPECKGRGYRRFNVERTRGRPPRWENENCGCPQCKGTGAILK
jgi:hypothetical protein